MREADWAEWMIARFTSRDRAASIVGDLLESQLHRGALWFWLSFIGIVLSLNRRRLVAFFIAFVCFHFLRGLPMPVFAPLSGRPPADEPLEMWQSFFVFLGWIAMLLWVVTPYALLRYGFRDRFGQVALAFCVPITTAIFYWWIPGIVVTCMALALCIPISSVVFNRRPSVLLALVLALVLGYCGVQLTLYLAAWYLELASPSAILSLLVNRDLAPFFGAVVLTFACGWAHQRLLQPDALAEIAR